MPLTTLLCLFGLSFSRHYFFFWRIPFARSYFFNFADLFNLYFVILAIFPMLADIWARQGCADTRGPPMTHHHQHFQMHIKKNTISLKKRGHWRASNSNDASSSLLNTFCFLSLESKHLKERFKGICETHKFVGSGDVPEISFLSTTRTMLLECMAGECIHCESS